jgi:chromosome segregation ATPase
MVYSCKKEVNRARNDRDDARRDAEKFKRNYNDMYSKYNDTNNKLNDTKNKLNDTTNKLNDTTNKLNDTTNKLLQTRNTLEQSIIAYNTQTDEMGVLTNRINVSEYFSVKEGLNADEADNIHYNFKVLDRNLYTAMQDQNSQLATEIEKYRNEHSTDDQKVNYEQQNIYLLLNTNYALKWIYFVLFLVVVYFLYYTKQYSMYFKIGLIILLTIYPFVIYTVEEKSYEFFKFLWSFVHPK